MSARDLRYEWLKRLAKDKQYDFIATAHHLDDSIETFFINLLRGTGIAGLQGIPVKQGNIVRPLLFANKKMIRGYAEENKLQWREDSSNFTDKYLRNSIRHHLIPSLKRMNEGFEKTITKELSYFKEAGDIFKKFIEEKKKEIIAKDGKTILLNIKKLKDSGHAETILHEILRAYDFNPETTELIAQRMYTTAGKKFLSPTYRLIKDREFLILTPKQNPPSREARAAFFEKEGLTAEKKKFSIKKNQTNVQNEYLKLKMEIISGNILNAAPGTSVTNQLPEALEGNILKNKNPDIAYLDLAKLEFPLTLRKWKRGDFFFPLGMKGKKKLSDFFIDIKLPVNNKEEVWVLESSADIVWVIGYRIDERFKITLNTKKIFRAERVW
jgi:tRNA(Ile)-lysidine synthase